MLMVRGWLLQGTKVGNCNIKTTVGGEKRLLATLLGAEAESFGSGNDANGAGSSKPLKR
jgi:hypothetical protein